MKLRDLLGIGNGKPTVLIKKFDKYCTKCKSTENISYVIFKYKFDDNFLMSYGFEFICDDCINSLCSSETYQKVNNKGGIV